MGTCSHHGTYNPLSSVAARAASRRLKLNRASEIGASSYFFVLLYTAQPDIYLLFLLSKTPRTHIPITAEAAHDTYNGLPPPRRLTHLVASSSNASAIGASSHFFVLFYSLQPNISLCLSFLLSKTPCTHIPAITAKDTHTHDTYKWLAPRRLTLASRILSPQAQTRQRSAPAHISSFHSPRSRIYRLLFTLLKEDTYNIPTRKVAQRGG